MTFNKFIETLQEIKDSGSWKNPDISVKTYIPMSEKFAAIRHIGAVINKEIDNLLQDKNFGYSLHCLKNILVLKSKTKIKHCPIMT